MKSLCVYCGSNFGADPIYKQVAQELGGKLAQTNITLVYGGGNVGLMGVIADSCLAQGGRVVGVITKELVEKEVAHKNLSELIVVNTMHERKALMAEMSDGFLALPGGIGTLEEIMEAFTWLQLGIHLKPCAILNVNGFFDGLVAQFGRMQNEKFIRSELLEQFVIEAKVERVIERLVQARPQVFHKWVDS